VEIICVVVLGKRNGVVFGGKSEDFEFWLELRSHVCPAIRHYDVHPSIRHSDLFSPEFEVLVSRKPFRLPSTQIWREDTDCRATEAIKIKSKSKPPSSIIIKVMVERQHVCKPCFTVFVPALHFVLRSSLSLSVE
jgi:hypothetical protein